MYKNPAFERHLFYHTVQVTTHPQSYWKWKQSAGDSTEFLFCTFVLLTMTTQSRSQSFSGSYRVLTKTCQGKQRQRYKLISSTNGK